MRNLVTLQSTAAGRRLLEENFVFGDPGDFLRQLQPPRSPLASEAAHQHQLLPVYAHQQVYLDYRSSVVAKFQALRTLRDLAPDVRPEFIWIDTDRAASDKLALRLYLPATQGGIPVRLAPSGCEKREPRFIEMDPSRMRDATSRIERILQQSPDQSCRRLERFEHLRPFLNATGTLATLSRNLTDFLLSETLAFQPRPILVSGMIETGDLKAGLETILNRQREFVRVFNAALKELVALDVAPQVKPLPDDYLPLFMTCPSDRSRLRLRLEQVGETHFAGAVSALGVHYRYELGRTNLTMEHLDRQVDWSPDVTLPILLNDRYSGMVAGKSSALYMLVFRKVIRKVMETRPLPILVPTQRDVFPGAFDILIEAYLTARKV